MFVVFAGCQWHALKIILTRSQPAAVLSANRFPPP